MDFLPGAMIGGKYRLERKIAEGGVGEVWIAVDQKSRRVAIKRLLPDTAKDRELVARFRREAVLLGKLHSEHVAEIIEQITDPKFGLILVMEFVDGESLADLLDRRRKLPVPDIIAIAIDVAKAVAVLHDANIIHRDLKPENVILRRLSAGGTKAVLIDFGFARLDPHGQGKRPNDDALTGITRADTMLGTVAYMAPEQVLNSRDVGRAADVYALGAMLYRAMSGKHVFGDLDDVAYARAKLDGEAPPLAIDHINITAAAVAKIIMRAIKRRPAERFEPITAMLKELENVRDSAPRADDADAPTQNASVSSLLGTDAPDVSKVDNVTGTSQTDRVVVNVAPTLSDSSLLPTPANTSSPDESSVTRPRQVGTQTIPFTQANHLAIPPAPPLLPVPAPAIPAPGAALPPLRLAPPPVPPKLPPASAAPGADGEIPAHLRDTARNRAIVVPSPPAPGVDDEMPAHLRNTAQTRALQMPPPLVEGTRKQQSTKAPLGMAIVVSILMGLVLGIVIGWVMCLRLSGIPPWETPPAKTTKP